MHPQMLRQNAVYMKRSGTNRTEEVFNSKMVQNMIVNLLHRDCRVAAKLALDLAILVDSRVHVEQQAPDCCEFAKLTREFFVSQSSSPSSPVKLCFMLPQADLCVRNKLAVIFAARILSIIVSFGHVLNK
jgi:hypothetical protein